VVQPTHQWGRRGGCGVGRRGRWGVSKVAEKIMYFLIHQIASVFDGITP